MSDNRFVIAIVNRTNISIAWVHQNPKFAIPFKMQLNTDPFILAEILAEAIVDATQGSSSKTHRIYCQGTKDIFVVQNGVQIQIMQEHNELMHPVHYKFLNGLPEVISNLLKSTQQLDVHYD